MGAVKRFWNWVRGIKPIVWVLLLAAVAAVVVLFIGGLYAWDYTNSSYFCGTTCHPMPPHYDSYLRSPHARVQCVECHIGRTFAGTAIGRKAGDLRYIIGYLSNQYTFPIYAKEVQPARESCEKCHWPEKFSWDKVVSLRDYLPNEGSSPITTTLILKTGGGSQRAGLGRGIHWHIENPIDFIYTDELLQEIPYVEVTNPDGTKTVYTDLENPLTPEQIASLPRRRMDCIDCHNRVSHTFLTPAEAMDNLLSTRQIDPTIPFIREKGTEVLGSKYGSSLELAKQGIARVEEFYKQNYPEYYQQNTAAIKNAVARLQEWYPKLHYPEQGLDWSTHPNNLGHKDWPGCFRCHDGKHFTLDRKEAIRLECNICHTIPAVAKSGQSAPAISLERIEEPESHKKTTWLIEHRSRFDASCAQCHDTRNAGGSDNSSFCSNSACHGTKWQFAGFDAPSLAQLFKPPVQPPSDPNATPSMVPHPVGGNPDCQICHGFESRIRPMPADHEGRANNICLACHIPTIPPEETTSVMPPPIPHDLAGRAECLGCHGSGLEAIPQIPTWHQDLNFTSGQCTQCHQPGKPPETLPAQTPPPTAQPTLAPAQPTAAVTPVEPTSAPTEAAPATVEPTAQTTPMATRASQTVTATRAITATVEVSPTPGTEGTPELGPRQPEGHETLKECLVCHATGALGAPKIPEDHEGRAETQCAECHKQED